jgi:hypothetical protein
VCSGGLCVCPSGQTDCSGTCRALASDKLNCGSCNNNCTTHPNATSASTCSGGNCSYVCSAGWGDCSGGLGCETQLNSLTHCGGCNVGCSRPNGTVSCATGTCTLTGCNAGWNNCDGDATNGCEVNNAPYSNSPPGQSIGAVPIDSRTGSFCSAMGCVLHSSYTGTRSRYFTMLADDQSSCGDYNSVKYVLKVPAGVNYDISVSSPNQIPGSGGCYCEVNGGAKIIGNTCTASNSAGQNDQIVLWCDPPLSSTPDFTVNIDVKYVSGASCSPWTLEVWSRQC